MAYDYLTYRGIIVADTADILAEVQAEWREAFGADVSLEPETPQGMLMAMEVRSRAEAARAMASFANQQMNPDYASSIFLDAMWAFMGGERRQATRSTVDGVLFSGVPGTIIPGGAVAKTTAGDQFRTVSSLIIGSGGTVTGSMVAVETGPIEASVGTLTVVAGVGGTSVLGWEQVYNGTAAVPGRDVEDDLQSRRRRKQTLAANNISANEAIISSLYALEGVRSLSYRENIASTTQTIDGISMIAHSIYVCIDGGTDADIAAVLKKEKTLGAAYNGSQTVTITDDISGQPYTVKFDRPTPVDLFVRVTVKATSLNAQDIIPQAIIDAGEGKVPGAEPLSVGVNVSPFELSASLNFVEPRLFVQKIELSINATDWQTSEWVIDIDEVPRIALGAVSVVIV